MADDPHDYLHDHDDELITRLHAMGQQPVDEGLRRQVLGRIAAAPPRRSWWRSTRTKVAAAAAGGFLVGSVGLASAGSLPAPAQDVAHSALDVVGVHVPPGHDRYNDPTACPGGPYRNHGEYVRAHKDDPNAGASSCGKPTHAVNPGNGDGNGNGNGSGNGNGRGGPPPWAHGNGKHKGTGGDQHDEPAPTTTTPPTTTAPSTSTSTTSTSTTSTSTSTTSTSTTSSTVP